MFLSKKHKILLIPNPRCATASICKSLQMKPVKGWDVHRPFIEFRRAHFNTWENYTTMIVVRDPVQRFLSACESTNTTPESMLPLLKNWKECERRIPRIFQPQSSFLCKIDLVIGLPWVAEFFNHNLWPILKKDNMLHAPGRPREVSDEMREQIEEYYSADMELLGGGSTAIPIWTPDESVPRFIWGDCSECAAKFQRSNDFA